MVVVGGRSVANTKELTRLCEIAGTPAIQIESVRDLDRPGGLRRRRGRRRHRRHVDPDRGPPARSPSGSSRSPGRAEAAAAAARAGRGRAAGRRDAGRPDDLAADPRPERRQRPPAPPDAWPRSRTACRSSPSSGARTSARARSSTGSSATRTAIVEDRARTTRDRLYGDAEWNGRRFVDRRHRRPRGSTRTTRSRRASRSRRAWRSPRPTSSSSSSTPTTGHDPARPGGGRAPAPARRRRSSSPSTRPTTRSASSRPPSSTRSAGTRPTRSAPPTGAGRGDLLDAIVWALPPESERGARAQGPRGRGRGLGRRGRRGPARAVRRRRRRGRRRPTATTATTPTSTAIDAEAAALGRGDGRRGRRRAAPRSPSSAARTSASRACSTRCSARSGRSCQRHPGHDPRRDRHAARLGPQRGRPHRHRRASGGAARSPRARPRSATRRCGRSRRSSRADVAVLVIDAVDGLTAQDAHVAGYVVEEGKGLVIAVNKWDLVEDKTDRTFDQYVEWIRREVAVPRLRAGRVDQRQDRPARRPGPGAAVDVWGERRKRDLDRRAQPAARPRPPSGTPPPLGQGPPAEDLLRDPGRGRAADVRRSSPATPAAVHFSYRRYLENRLREAFGFDGTPIRLVFRDRSSVKLPRRKKAGARAGPARRRGAPDAPAPRRPAGSLMAGPRVAVVGAGAWGTTLRRSSPAASRSRSCATPRRRRRGSRETGRNEARLPGVDLPRDRRRDRRPGGARRRDRARRLRRRRRRTCARRSSGVAPYLAAGGRPRCRWSRASSAARCCG